MWYILFTIILLLFTVKAFVKSKAEGNFDEALYIPLVAFFFCILYLLQYLEFVADVAVGPFWKITGFMMANMLIPAAYMYVCKRCNITVLSASTIGMIALVLLNLFPQSYVYLDDIPLREDIYGIGWHFIRHGKQLLYIHAYEFVVLLQSLWVFVRISILYTAMRERELHITKNAKITLYTIYFILIMLIVTVFVPDYYYERRWYLFVYFTVHLTFACFCIYLAANGYTKTLIVDKNSETAYIQELPKSSILKEKLEYLMHKEHLYKDNSISVEYVAQRMDTNRTYLSRLMREEYDTTFVNYINTLRVEEAKRLLRENRGQKLEDIAKMSGFASASTFTKTFKAITGVTPHMWR